MQQQGGPLEGVGPWGVAAEGATDHKGAGDPLEGVEPSEVLGH